MSLSAELHRAMRNLIQKFSRSLENRGRATLGIDVVVSQKQKEIFTATFSWFVAKSE